MVAAGLSPRNNGEEWVRVAERRLNRRGNQALHASLPPSRRYGRGKPRRPVFALPPRGLKPTATIIASLREAEPEEPWRPKTECRLQPGFERPRLKP
jgi:hypothetical protein